MAGVLTAPDGALLPNARLHIVADRNEASGVIKGAPYTFVTSGVAAYSFQLLDGYYRVMRDVDGAQLFMGYILIEDNAEPETLTNLLALNEVPSYPGVTGLALLASQARADRDAANLANQAAQSALAQILALVPTLAPVVDAQTFYAIVGEPLQIALGSESTPSGPITYSVSPAVDTVIVGNVLTFTPQLAQVYELTVTANDGLFSAGALIEINALNASPYAINLQQGGLQIV